MSGIGGIFHRNGAPVEPTQLQAMGTALAHRGPDGINYFSDSNIGLLHCALHDTPESLFEKLPAQNQRSRRTITWQGRIDNREELRDSVGWSKPLSQTTDSELILAAYEKWGHDCVYHLLGDFAFVIWDAAAQSLFCARDHMGVMPFYYYLSDDIFVFASEIKGIRCLPLKDTSIINTTRIAEFLTCEVTDEESTFYTTLFRLPPGHYFKITRDNSLIEKFWEPHATTLFCKKDSEYREAFYSIFKESVRCRLRTAFPIGSYLSGGLDSSSIVCMAAGPLQNCYPGTLHSFSGIFNTVTECDERHFFNSTLARYNISPNFIEADTIHPGKAFEQVANTEDEPFFAPHFFMVWNLMGIAEKKGIRVILDGHDGDSAVSHGEGLYNDLFIRGRWLRLLQECYATGNTQSLKKALKLFAYIARQRISYDYGQLFPSFYHKKDIQKMTDILNPSFLQNSDMRERLLSFFHTRYHPAQTEKIHHHLLVKQPLRPLHLELFERQNKRQNLIGRYPFFDKRLIEFCLALPTQHKRHKGYNRNILRNALRSIFPEKISKRKSKTYFDANINHVFSTAAKEWLQFSIDNISKETYDYVNRKFSQQACDSFFRESTRFSFVDIRILLKIVSLDVWNRKVRG